MSLKLFPGATRAFSKNLVIALFAGALACTLSSNGFAAAGDLYVTDLATNSVIVYTPDGVARTFATGLHSPQGLVFDQAKNLYVADAGSGNIFKYDLAGNQTTFITGLSNPVGLTLDGSDLLVSENSADRVSRLPLDGTPPKRLFVDVAAPLGLTSRAFDQSGFTRYIAHDNSLLKVDTELMQTEIALGAGARAAAATSIMLPDGSTERDVFATTDAGTVLKIINDGTPVLFASGITDPHGMDFRPKRFSNDTDRVGNLYVADTLGHQILQYTPSGTRTTFASGGNPNFLAFETRPVHPVLLQNISTRAQVLGGDNVLIGGFIVMGGNITTPKTVAIRAIGPSLSHATPPVEGVLADPVLELHKKVAGVDTIIASNDNWKTNTPADQMTITDNGLDQFASSPISDLESIIVATLPPVDPNVPGSGAYTAIVRGINDTTGIALAEVYDLDDPTTALTELANISTRGVVGTGENVMIGGIIVGPATNSGEVILRAIGPSLGNATPPVADPLQDPTLELVDANGDQLAFNDNWQDGYDTDELQRNGLAPTNEAESAIVATLSAGVYTAIVRGVNDTTGVALVEAYHIPAPLVTK